MMCWLLFHPQSLSVGDMNFVHWLSSFCYPDGTTATLLDQVDHPFGYICRPANKTISHVLKCDWPIVWAEDQVLYLNRDVSSSFLSEYSYVENRLKMSIELLSIVIEISDGFSQAIWRSSE